MDIITKWLSCYFNSTHLHVFTWTGDTSLTPNDGGPLPQSAKSVESAKKLCLLFLPVSCHEEEEVYGGEKGERSISGSWGVFRSSSCWWWQISWQALSCARRVLKVHKIKAADLGSLKQCSLDAGGTANSPSMVALRDAAHSQQQNRYLEHQGMQEVHTLWCSAATPIVQMLWLGNLPLRNRMFVSNFSMVFHLPPVWLHKDLFLRL